MRGRVWSQCNCGCGVYRNLETGLVRVFKHGKPRRGKWEFQEHIRRPLPPSVQVFGFIPDYSEGL